MLHNLDDSRSRTVEAIATAKEIGNAKASTILIVG